MCGGIEFCKTTLQEIREEQGREDLAPLAADRNIVCVPHEEPPCPVERCGLRVEGRVWGLRCGVQGAGLGVGGSGLRV